MFRHNMMRTFYAKLLILSTPFLLTVYVKGHCFTQDNDFVGNPVRGIKDFHIDQIESPEDCQTQCQADADCEFWVWNGPNSSGNKNTCWLKSNNGESATSVGKVSGPKAGCIEVTTSTPETTTPEPEKTTQRDTNSSPTWDCSAFYMENTSVGRGPGNGIGGKISNVQSVEDCRAECWKVAECKFFIWNSPESRRQKLTCRLKRNSANSRSNRNDIGRISGPVTCDMEEGQELDKESADGTIDCSSFYLENTSVGIGGGGGNSAGKLFDVLTADDCRAECGKVALCKFFIWHSPQAEQDKLRCFLKKNNNNRRSEDKDIGKISGPVSC